MSYTRKYQSATAQKIITLSNRTKQIRLHETANANSPLINLNIGQTGSSWRTCNFRINERTQTCKVKLLEEI